MRDMYISIYACIRRISLAKYGNESRVAITIHKSIQTVQMYVVMSPKLEEEIGKYSQTRISESEQLVLRNISFLFAPLYQPRIYVNDK